MPDSPAPDDIPIDWPHHDSSRRVRSGSLDWHVQVMGTGPAILLLHGAGAASHSWRDVAPALARDFTVIVPDLPGHGFTRGARDDALSLEAIAASLDALCTSLGLTPNAIAGHSAGGALALRLAMLRPTAAVIGFNAALEAPRDFMPVLAPGVRSIARSGVLGAFTAWLATNDAVFTSLMRSTGSSLSPEQMARYRTFATSAAHTNALMVMFSSWDMTSLLAGLPSLATPVTLAVGTRDAWIPPVTSRRVARMLPHASVIDIPDAGHLAHEEFPDRAAEIIRSALVTGDPR